MGAGEGGGAQLRGGDEVGGEGRRWGWGGGARPHRGLATCTLRLEGLGGHLVKVELGSGLGLGS